MARPVQPSRLSVILLISGAAALVWSGIAPLERSTWALEVFPAVAGAAAFVGLRRRFRFSNLAYLLAWLYALVLIAGGHWTYAQNPLGNWVKEALHLQRNHFDRLGHLMQGVVPAILAREVLLRCTPLRAGGWLNMLIVCVCLAVSAFYELIEWWVSLIMEDGATNFLGTQGDVWDTQWDMFMCLCGACLSLATLRRLHDRSMAVLGPAG